MRSFSLIATLALAITALAQVPGTPINGSAQILVSTIDTTGTVSASSVGCLNTEGQVTASTADCATFSLSSETSVFGGSPVDAGSGACGFIPKNPHGPLGCNSTVPSEYVLGFYELDGKLATQEMFTEWSIDAEPADNETQNLFKQGLHPIRVVMSWSPV
ncbi:hypothetical protein AURDEDRAFT_164584 [Auricularia subglabra TFB-10046 SS5]|nr:hypothetical protein AURDEDRAFT_164584 [Auricularia subglabra TFB-10046 SS5]